MTPGQYLLIVTVDGFGKRVAVDEIRRMKQTNRIGVKVATAPIAFSQVVDDLDADLVLASANGQIERLRVGDVPTRRRQGGSGRRLSKGARIMRLNPGDRVAAGAVTSIDAEQPQTSSAGFEDDPRVQALRNERKALNERMERDPKQRTYANYGARDAIDLKLERLKERQP